MGTSSRFRESVAQLQPEQRPVDPVGPAGPADGLVWSAGYAVQCEL